MSSYLTSITGSGTSAYPVDASGQPWMFRGDFCWSLITNAGQGGSGGGTYQQDMTNYLSTRASQGFNQVYCAAVTCAVVSPCGRYLGTGGEGDRCGVQVWDCATGALVCALPVFHRRAIACLAWSHDARQVQHSLGPFPRAQFPGNSYLDPRDPSPLTPQS